MVFLRSRCDEEEQKRDSFSKLKNFTEIIGELIRQLFFVCEFLLKISLPKIEYRRGIWNKKFSDLVKCNQIYYFKKFFILILNNNIVESISTICEACSGKPECAFSCKPLIESNCNEYVRLNSNNDESIRPSDGCQIATNSLELKRIFPSSTELSRRIMPNKPEFTGLG